MPWRRRNWDIFDFFDREFEEIMENMFRSMDFFRRSGIEEPFVKGFAIKPGPWGRPQVKEFGSKPTSKEGFYEHKPFTDVIDEEDKVRIIAEVPGVNKDGIDVQVSETEAEIKAVGDKKRYHEKVDLENEVIPDSAKARYNNGVLEIELKKKKEAKIKKIKVE